MKTKKIICAVLAATIISTAAFASCGGSTSSNNSGATTTAVETKKQITKDIDAISNSLKDSLDEKVKGTMTAYDENRITKMIGVKKELYKKAVCLVDASGASAHEIDCFEANDENAAKEIETALKERIEKQKKQFKDYVPEEMKKLEDPVLVVEGNYVFMCLSNDNTKAKEIIGK